MASFDIVSKVDLQTLDNAINAARKEVQNRYDFRGSNSTIDLDKKTMILHIVTEDDMKMDNIEKVIIGRMVRQKLDAGSLDFGKELYASGNMIKKDIQVRQGIGREAAKKIVKAIKDMRLKVQPAVMDDQIRVTGKKINDLQAVIGMCKRTDFEVPLQYINMK
jgi:uncharacterized protein YajQ (UPF0234 family)